MPPSYHITSLRALPLISPDPGGVSRTRSAVSSKGCVSAARRVGSEDPPSGPQDRAEQQCKPHSSLQILRIIGEAHGCPRAVCCIQAACTLFFCMWKPCLPLPRYWTGVEMTAHPECFVGSRFPSPNRRGS